MRRPDGGMFGIKLILPNHLDIPQFTHPFDGTDGRWPLMNFSGEGRGPATAANIPVGHRSLVYVTKHGKFIWAIEYVGSVEDGEKCARAQGIEPRTFPSKWNVFLPIRFLATVELHKAPTAAELFEKTGIRFTANSFAMKYISATDYQRLYDAIDWDK